MLLSVESPNRGSLCTRASRGHAAALQRSGASSPAGVGLEHVQTDNRGSPGTWEILSFPRQYPGWRHRVTNSRPCRRTRPSRSERNECNRGTAKRRKRSAAGRAAGSRSTLSTDEAGELLPQDPVKGRKNRKGVSDVGTWAGKYVRGFELGITYHRHDPG